MGKNILFLLSLSMVIHSGGAIASEPPRARGCMACHGKGGISSNPLFPNLAGQKKAYLAKQLQDFRAKKRLNATMNAVSKSLSDEDIETLSSYFAGLGCGKDEERGSGGATTPVTNAREAEFPAPVFVTLRDGGIAKAFPSGRTYGGGKAMLYDALTPDAKRLLVTDPEKNSLLVFDTEKGRELAAIPVGKSPKGVKVSPDGSVAYVANEGSDSISVVDLKALEVSATIPVKKAPHNIVFGPGGRMAYVTLQGGAGLGVLDTRTNGLVRVMELPGLEGPHNLDISPDGRTAYVRDTSDKVAIVDLVKGVVTKIVEVGRGHGGIDLSPDGRFLVTGAIGDEYVSVIDTKTMGVTKTRVGSGPHGLRVSRDNRWIYVAVTGQGVLAVIDTKTMKVVRRIALGKAPFWVAVEGNP